MKKRGLIVLASVAILSLGGGLQSKASELNVKELNFEPISDQNLINVKLNVDYSNAIKTYSDVERYITLLEEYKSSNPEATIKEQDNYLSLIMGEIMNKDSGQIVTLDIPYVENMLNSKEIVVFNSNKVYGLQALLAAQKATNYAENIYTSATLHNGNGDAYRHILWNTLMRNYTTKAYAESFATAHEEGSSGQPALEKQMDLFNNEVGRNITFNGTNLEGELNALSAVKSAVDGGKGKRISGTALIATNATGKK
ncbi:hypothetical protein [Lysinibacillus sp. S2017]|uniref:DUF6973 domain-containing protein n=1 Tax=Lysinibacillus sp. S2017 TaxID=2561923 RepID=UPI0010922B91|nr:hypothetical protein [Lysinibacillus sp. S2017]TGN33105.1 hypothetical protein E4L99_15205 [Lysinibacillus sp. S2017]